MDDWRLLREYVEKGSEGAFEALVGRYLGMVYGVALRKVRGREMAEDVTQAVFGLLAQKAEGMREGTMVAGWLFRTTRFAAGNVRKMERRRRIHEGRAGRMRVVETGEEGREERMRLLDRAMERLSERDRGAVLMRYYRRMEMSEVGRVMGVSEGAARRRVERAVGKLRRWMGSGEVGVDVGAVGVVGVVTAEGMATGAIGIAKGAAGREVVKVIMKGALKMMWIAKMKVAAAVVVAAMVVSSVGVVTVRRLAAEGVVEKPVATTRMVDVDREEVIKRMESMRGQIMAQVKTVDDIAADLRTFRQSHAIPLLREGVVLQYERLAKLQGDLDAADLKVVETTGVADKYKTREDNGSLADDKPTALKMLDAAIDAKDAALLMQKSLRLKYDEATSRMQNLEFGWEEYERKEADLKTQQGILSDLVVKGTLYTLDHAGF